MSSHDNYQPAALDDILRTLSQYSSTPVAPSTIPAPNQVRLSDNLASQSIDPRSRPRPHALQGDVVQQAPRSAQIDPSSITAWPQALKYVMSSLSQSAAASSRLKTLIHSQHQHEKQWWAGRQSLISRLEGRDEGQKKANDLLRMLGSGKAEETSSTTQADPDVKKKELEIYDAKVYRALSEMTRAMNDEFRTLGVPFFAIKHELIDAKADESSKTKPGALGKKELLELQKRMLQLLQDLLAE